jgi:hypothetical protein
VSSDAKHERYRIAGADDLFSDTWAEDVVCPNCGAELEPGAGQCRACRQWIGECGHSCPGCPSPRCVGGDREKRTHNRERAAGRGPVAGGGAS